MFLILRKALATKLVVFLVPTRSRAGDWNPFLVGFTGMRLLHPFRSVPFIIKVPDDAWKPQVQSLIQQSETIILDVSHTSDAIQTELQMIEQASGWHKTTFLKNVSAETRNEVEEKLPVGAFQINYTKSWTRALPRLILGAFFMFVMWAFIESAAAYFTLQIESITISMVIFVLLIPVCIGIYFSLFWRASIDGESKQSLKNLIRGQQPEILAADVQNTEADDGISSADAQTSPAGDGN